MGKLLRFIGILFLSVSALFNILGGVGTTCVALNPLGYAGKFEALASVQWLYIIFVIVTIGFGAMMVRSVFLLLKGRDNAYRSTLIALIGAVIFGIIHVIVSRSLRGGSMPVDGVVYTTLFTLLLFLIFKIPAVWDRVDFKTSSKKENDLSGGAATITVGILNLTIHHLVANTHTINGINYGDLYHFTMTGIGWTLVIFGCCFFSRFLPLVSGKEEPQSANQP